MGHHRVCIVITFDVELENMLTKNFNNALQQSKVVLNNWKKRYLTPFGKIAVIKTFIISKFSHLFLSLPNPTYNMFKALTDLIYDFLWDGKPDKISRKQICKEYLEGGLKMIDINKFIKSLKSTWIRRFLKDSDAPQHGHTLSIIG